MTDGAGSKRRRGWTPLPDKSSPPVPISRALDNLASTLGLGDLDSVEKLFLHWGEIAGSNLAEHCRPVSLRERTLTVAASDQQWATELKWMTGLLMERCNDALGSGTVTAVRITR